MKLWKWLLLAVVVLYIGAIAVKALSQPKVVYVKCVGALYAKDGSEQPATAFVEFKMWPWWIWWSKEQGDWSLEMTDPVTVVEHGYVRGFGGGKHTLVGNDVDESKRQTVGVFSAQSSSIGIETSKGNFVGECERHDRITLYNGRP